MLNTAENPRVHIGANHPPTDQPAPRAAFEAIKIHIDDLFEEAKNWCDGTPIETDAQAEKVQALLRMMQAAHDLADEARVKENEPFDQGKAEVQERYAPLIANTKRQVGKTVKAIAACKQAIGAWLIKKEKARQAEVDRLRKEAEAAAAEALAATQTARRASDLGAIEAAEQTVADARNAEIAARRVETTTSKVGGIGRAVGLRDNWIATLAVPQEALKHYLTTDPESVKAWLLQRGQQDVRTGKRTIPGFTVENHPVAA